MKIKNIVWDWNGTIVDDSWLFVEIMNIFLKKHGLPQTSIQDYRKSFVFPIKKYWASLGFVLNSNEFENINSKFINLYKTQMFRASLHSKITCVLNSLKQEGFVQILLSASEKSLLQKGLSFYKLDDFFHSFWGVNNFNATGKTQLSQNLLLKTKIQPSETLLIGDTLYDLEVANACGFECLLVSYGHFNQCRLNQKHSKVVNSPAEVLNFVLSNYNTM